MAHIHIGRLAANLRWLRKLEGLTLQWLAEELGVSISLISKWEHGHRAPRMPHLRALARAYNTSIDSLINDDLTGLFTSAADRPTVEETDVSE